MLFLPSSGLEVEIDGEDLTLLRERDAGGVGRPRRGTNPGPVPLKRSTVRSARHEAESHGPDVVLAVRVDQHDGLPRRVAGAPDHRQHERGRHEHRQQMVAAVTRRPVPVHVPVVAREGSARGARRDRVPSRSRSPSGPRLPWHVAGTRVAARRPRPRQRTARRAPSGRGPADPSCPPGTSRCASAISPPRRTAPVPPSWRPRSASRRARRR